MAAADDIARRPLTEADAEAVAALRCELERALGYRGEATAVELRDWWRFTELERNSWAFEEGGGLVALGWVTPHGEAAHVDGSVAPSAQGRGLGATLCELGESRARELGFATVQQHAYEADAAARALFEARGYREVRRFYEMAVELDGPPPSPSWPEGMAPAVFRPEDARGYYDAIVESFGDEWGFVARPFDEWKQLRVDESDTSLYFLAWDGDDVAGIIRCEVRGRTGFVGMLGIRRGWRQRGIGRALLLHALGVFYERGERRIALGVDSENSTGATRLYESVGMTVQSAAIAYELRLG